MGVCVGTVDVVRYPLHTFSSSLSLRSRIHVGVPSQPMFSILYFSIHFVTYFVGECTRISVRPLQFFVFLVVFIFFFRHAEKKKTEKFVFIKKEEIKAPRVNRARARSREIVCVKRLCSLFIHSSAIGN